MDICRWLFVYGFVYAFFQVMPAFIHGLICYVEGHGLHLSANAIDRLLGGQEDTALHQSVYIYDEVISHFVWDSGVPIIAAGLILAGAGVPKKRNKGFWDVS